MDTKLIERVQRQATKLITGMQGLNYNDRLKELGLMKLEGRRMRSDLVETFKIDNGKYDINPELLSEPGYFGTRTVPHQKLVLKCSDISSHGAEVSCAHFRLSWCQSISLSFRTRQDNNEKRRMVRKYS